MPDRAAERLIANRYALAVPIGQGGMGLVWRARDTVLGREVAIKEVMLPPTIPDSERSSMRARVLREARAAARLNHPDAVTIYDVINEQGHAFIVMELISAPTLAHVVSAEGPLDPRRVALIGARVAGALAAAHDAGIVHRDVKPANVMVVKDGARLTDFGIARVKGDPKLTSTGLIVGSPAYMAPEQATGKAAGPEADLWGLGATLYYAVEGQAPFDRDGSIATLTAVVNDDPRPAARAGELGPIIGELLSKDPRRRPSAEGLRVRLERIAAAEPPGGEASPGDTDRFPQVDGGASADPPVPPVAAVPPVPVVPPGPPVEVTRPGPSRPGRQRHAQVRPDQPARPPRASQLPTRDHPTAVAPPPGDAAPAAAPEGAAPEGDDLAAPVAEAAPAAAPAERAAPADGAGVNVPGPEAADVNVPGPRAAAAEAAAGTAAAGGGAGDGARDGAGAGALRPAGSRMAGRRPLLIGTVVAVALIAAAFAITSALRDGKGGAPAGSNASATSRSGSPVTTAPTAPATTAGSSRAPTSSGPATTKPSGGTVPAGWTAVTSPAGAYSFAYPPGWRVSSQSAILNTIQVSGPGGRLFKTQSSSPPSDPMQAWKEQELSFRSRPGYQRIRLEPGTYKGLAAAVWEFTVLEGGRRVHKLDVTFKSASGRWGYAVLLQAPEAAWSGTVSLWGQFERAFTPTG